MADKDAGTPRVYLVRHGKGVNPTSPALASVLQN